MNLREEQATMMTACEADRILARLIQSESREGNPHLRDDYRQSFILVSLASQGDPQPMVNASYRLYGCHPDQLFARITARRQAQLGKEYSQWYDAAGNLKPEWLDIPDYDPTSGMICSVPLDWPAHAGMHAQLPPEPDQLLRTQR